MIASGNVRLGPRDAWRPSHVMSTAAVTVAATSTPSLILSELSGSSGRTSGTRGRGTWGRIIAPSPGLRGRRDGSRAGGRLERVAHAVHRADGGRAEPPEPCLEWPGDG